MLATLLAFATSDAAAGYIHGRSPVLYTDPAHDAVLVMDAKSGRVLWGRNENLERHPASLTKMMTLYLIFERLRDHRLTLQTRIASSMNAATQAPMKIHFHAGDSLSLDESIRAITVCSANDVTVAVAENIAGTESRFAELMNAKAQQFGMTHTFFHNASGLPDALQVTSAHDLAVLARHLVYDFPQYLPYFSARSFTYRGAIFDTHDRLVRDYGADGLKTGYTDASGYNLVTTISRDGTRLIGVVLGGVSAERRDRYMQKILDATFARLQGGPDIPPELARLRSPS